MTEFVYNKEYTVHTYETDAWDRVPSSDPQRVDGHGARPAQDEMGLSEEIK